MGCFVMGDQLLLPVGRSRRQLRVCKRSESVHQHSSQRPHPDFQMSTSAATTAAMHAPVFVPAAPVQDDTAWSVVAPSPSDSATPTPPASATPAVPSTQAAAAWGKWPTIPTPSVDTSWSDTDTHAAPSVVSSHASKWIKGDCDIVTADGAVLTVPSYHLQSARWVYPQDLQPTNVQSRSAQEGRGKPRVGAR